MTEHVGEAIPSLKEAISRNLWQKFFRDLDRLAAGLSAFTKETDLEDEFPVTFRDFSERISSLVTRIEMACPPSLFDGTERKELSDLGTIVRQSHIELRLQRDAIWQASVSQATEPTFRQVFGLARQRFNNLARDLRAALDSVFDCLTTEEGESVDTSIGGV